MNKRIALAIMIIFSFLLNEVLSHKVQSHYIRHR
jgi:hypothetical protein